MLKQIRHWIAPPVFNDSPEKSRAAALLNVILLTLVGMGLIYGIFAPLDPALWGRRLSIMGPLLLSLAGVWWAMRRGHVRFASVAVIAALWLAFTAAMAYGGGYNNPAFMGYLVVTVCAGLLLGRRATLLWAVVGMITSALILLAGEAGVLPPAVRISDQAFWVAQGVYLLTVAVMLNLTMRRIDEAFARAQKELAERQQAEANLRASEEQYRMLFEEAPDGICIVDQHNRIVMVNPALCQISGFAQTEIIGREPNGFLAPEELIQRPPRSPAELRAAGSTRRERTLARKDGGRVQVVISSRYMPDGRFQYIVQDITERKGAEERIRQREAILDAVAFAAEKFLRTLDWRANIEAVLEKLGQKIGASHAYLFENHLAPDGALLTSIRYEWSAPGIPSDLEKPEYKNSLIYEPGFERWAEILARGEPFYGSRKTFPPMEAEQFMPRGIKSLLDMPVYIGEEWWGIIGFDDLTIEREWSSAEVDALKAAANIVAAAIQRERVDTALRQSEALYRRAIEAAGAVPYFRDYRLNTYTFMGEGIAQITGYSAIEMTPTLWDTLELEVHPRGALAGLSYAEAQSRARAGQVQQWECDYRIRTRDGQSRWVADSAVQVRDEQGARIGVIGILQDITDRKRSEDALRQSEVLYRRAIEAAGAVPYYLDYQTETYRFMGEGIRPLLGLAADEMRPGVWDSLADERHLLGELAPLPWPEAVRRIRMGEILIWQCDYLVRTSDGRQRWLTDAAVQEFDDQGNVRGSIGILFDITDRKLALEEAQKFNVELERRVAERTEALRASEARMRAMNDSSPLGVFFDDVGGQCVYTNATYQSILGLSPDGAMGAEWMKVLHPDDSDWVLASVQAAHSRQRAFELVHRYLRPDGRVVWASVKGAPVRVDDEVLGYVGTVEDITARVNAEEALKRRSAQLEAANQELEAFSYSVSHDLRAPVRAIGGFSRLLLQRYAEGLHPEAVHYLERVHHGAQHMGQLIDDLLAFARLGRQALRIQRLTTDDLAGLVNRSVADLRAEFPDRSVEVIIHDLPPCHADVALLKQVLINLLSNAFKFTQSRPIARIEVGSAPLFDGWAYSIRDNGVGFDMRYAHKLFNVFQRLHRSDEFEGTGVGLAIVQRIIHKHGGRIWAEAEVDNGSVFYFTLGALSERIISDDD